MDENATLTLEPLSLKIISTSNIGPKGFVIRKKVY